MWVCLEKHNLWRIWNWNFRFETDMQNVKVCTPTFRCGKENAQSLSLRCVFLGNNCYIHIMFPLLFFQAFFQRWWAEKSPNIQAIVRKLVDSGQLEFMYGMWISSCSSILSSDFFSFISFSTYHDSEMVDGACMMKLQSIILTWLIKPRLVTAWSRNNSIRLQGLAGKLILLDILRFKLTCLEQR